MSLLRRALGQERRATPFLANYGDGYYGYGGNGEYYGDGSVPPNSFVPNTWAGAPVTEVTALQLSAFYACVRLLADSVASLPWDAYRHKGQARIAVSPKSSLLRSPYHDLSVFDWKHQMVVSLAIRGNFYGLVVERDGLDYPTQIMPLHPDWVVITREPKSGEKLCYVNGTRVPTADLFHIKWFTLPGFDIGLSPLQVFRQSIGLGLASEEFGGKWFRDGAAPSSTLETDQALTPDQIKQTQREWVVTQGGKRLPAVLAGGFKWKPVTITPEESQFLETRRLQIEEIARVFGIPPHMIGDVAGSTSWGSGIESQSIGFVTYTLTPWLTRIESAFDEITPNGQHVKFNVDSLLRGDLLSRYQAFQMALDGGWMNPDEVRSKDDLPPIPDGKGQLFRQPLNMGPLGFDPATVPVAKKVPAEVGEAVPAPAATPAPAK